MADIFISYSHSDVDFVRDMVPKLESEGFSVWWDHTIPPGKTWDDVIAKGIDDAKACIIVWSPQSVVSDWVKEEATLAKQGGKYLPVQFGAGEPPIGFRRIQAANLQNWNGSAQHPQWRLLITEAARLVKGEERTDNAGGAAIALASTGASRPAPKLTQAMLIGLTATITIVVGGVLAVAIVWWNGSHNAAMSATRNAGESVVGIWNGNWRYDTDPTRTSNWMKGTFQTDGTVIGETSAGRQVAQWRQAGADVHWAFNDFNYVGKVTGNRLSGSFVGPGRTGVFEATR